MKEGGKGEREREQSCFSTTVQLQGSHVLKEVPLRTTRTNTQVIYVHPLINSYHFTTFIVCNVVAAFLILITID